MTCVGLFAGIGGIEIAAHKAGFETVALVEKDKYCQQVLARGFPGVPIYDDITTFNGRRYRGVDLVSAGFPCQPHSVAGKRLASRDERDLWSETVRVLGEAQPRWFLGENVPGLLSSESGRFFGRVVNDLAALGYRVGWCCYGASDVGACHRRKRVFIVGCAAEHGFNEQAVEGLPIRNEGKTGTTDSRRISSDSIGSNGETCGSHRLGNGPGRPPRASCCFSKAHDVSDSCGGRLSGQPRRRAGSIIETGYRELPSRDWRTWDIKPVFRSGDDGVPPGMVSGVINEEILLALWQRVNQADAAMRKARVNIPQPEVLQLALLWRFQAFSTNHEREHWSSACKAVRDVSIDFLREVWLNEPVGEASCESRPYGQQDREPGSSVPSVPQAITRRYSSASTAEALRDMWHSFYSKPLKKTQDMLEVVLESIGEAERIEKMGSSKHRVNILKALGNAVVPAQVFPILKAIAEVQ